MKLWLPLQMLASGFADSGPCRWCRCVWALSPNLCLAVLLLGSDSDSDPVAKFHLGLKKDHDTNPAACGGPNKCGLSVFQMLFAEAAAVGAA